MAGLHFFCVHSLPSDETIFNYLFKTIMIMKEKNLLLRLLMLMCALVFTVPKTWAAVNWNSSTKTLTISGSFAPGTWDSDEYRSYFYTSYSAVEHIVINGTLTSSSSNNFTGFFAGLSNLKDITGLNYIAWNSATYLTCLFKGCSSLESIDLGTYTFASATSMGQMFMNCSSLKSVNLSGFTGAAAQDMDNMFRGCTSLKNISLPNFVGTNLIGMGRFCYGCTSLVSVDLGKFTGNNLNYFDHVFYNCSNLAYVDLNSFTGNNADIDDCFYNTPQSGVVIYTNSTKLKNIINNRPNWSVKTYSSCTSVSAAWTNAQITLSQNSYTYSGSACQPTVNRVMIVTKTLNTGEKFYGLVLDTYNVSYSNNTNAGTGTVTLTSSSLSGSGTANFTINKKSVTVPSGITAQNKVYNGNTAATLVTTSAVFSGKVGSDNLTISATGTFSDANVGTNKTVTLSGLTLGGSQAGNYQLANSGNQATTTASITKKSLTVTANPRTITYGDAPANDGVTYSAFASNESSTVLGGTLAYNYSYSQFDDIGSYTITPSGLTSNNYDITFNTGTLTVNAKQVGLNWTNTSSLTYNGSAQKPTATATGTVNSDAITVNVTGEQTAAGTGYIATASSLTGDKAGNYTLPAEKTTTFSINKKDVTVSGITAQSKVYDGSAAATLVTDNASFDGTVGSDNLTISATGTFSDANVGTDKTVTLSGLTLGGTSVGDYQLASSGQQATTTASITKKSLTVTAKPKTITYGDAPANDGVTYSAFASNESQTVLGGTLAYNYSYSQFDDIGSYTITPSGLTSNNYDITFNTGTLTVNAKQVGLNWTNTSSLTYNGSAQKPTATATGTVNSDAITVNVTGEQTAAGTGYIATASSLTGDKAGNYTLPAANTTSFSIGRKTLQVTAEDKTINAGESDPALTYTSDGLVSGDNITGALSREEGDAVGSYAITQGSLTAGGNYEISFTEGTFTILRALGVSFNGGNRKWATYCAAEDLVIPDGMKVYMVTGASGNVVTLSEELTYIPQGVGVLLSYETSKNDFAAAKYNGTTSTFSGNKLVGTTTAIEDLPSGAYILYNNEFVQADGTTLAANRCYLPANFAATTAPKLTIGDATTNILPILADDGSDNWYDMSGRKLQGKPSTKGLYIKNGKKTIIK